MMAICEKCGKQLKDDAGFCPACGAPVNMQPVSPPQAAPPYPTPSPVGNAKIVFRYKKNALLYWNVSGMETVLLNNGITIFVPENNEIVYDAVPGQYHMIASIKTLVGIVCGVAKKDFVIGPNETLIITYKPPIFFSGRLKIEKFS